MTGAVAAVLRVVAALRRARALHPRGVSFVGRADLAPFDPPIATERSVPVVVRLSQGAGLPSSWPDLKGVAIRLLDAHGDGRHHDLLLTSGRCHRRRLLWPARSFRGTWFTTALPFRTPEGRRVWFGATVHGLDHLHEVADGEFAGDGRPAVSVSLYGTDVRGTWRTVGEIELLGRAERDVRYDVANTTPELRAAGWLNGLRPSAYAASREGWSGSPSARPR